MVEPATPNTLVSALESRRIDATAYTDPDPTVVVPKNPGISGETVRQVARTHDWVLFGEDSVEYTLSSLDSEWVNLAGGPDAVLEPASN